MSDTTLIEQALAEFLGGMSKWQPIETAPKDGTPVILAEPWNEKFIRYIGRWGELGGWQKGEYNQTYFTRRMQANFSHWQPLPEPPK